MHKDNEIDLNTRKYTSKLIVERAMARGWHVYGFDTNKAIYLLEIPGRALPIKIFSASPPQMSYPAVKIGNDKYISNQILAKYDLPVPKDFLINKNNLPIDDVLDSFIKKYKKVVVKPLDSSHGKGITVNVDNIKRLFDAIDEAKKYTAKSSILIQQQINGIDIRLLCIGYEFSAAITRTPAQVVGDGIHTIEGLIDIENNSKDRGENYKARLNLINKERALDFLGKSEMQKVPKLNQIVQVIGVANIGMGGERNIITKEVPDFLIKFAEKVASLMELPVCAVDFMTASMPHNNSTIDELRPYIIEVNGCPQLLVHDDPNSEDQNNFIDKYLDFVSKY